MNVTLSTVALKLINDLYRTGLFGASPEDTARQLIEEGLKKWVPESARPPAKRRKKSP